MTECSVESIFTAVVICSTDHSLSLQFLSSSLSFRFSSSLILERDDEPDGKYQPQTPAQEESEIWEELEMDLLRA